VQVVVGQRVANGGTISTVDHMWWRWARRGQFVDEGGGMKVETREKPKKKGRLRSDKKRMSKRA
jgi:hypothetical protein